MGSGATRTHPTTKSLYLLLPQLANAFFSEEFKVDAIMEQLDESLQDLELYGDDFYVDGELQLDRLLLCLQPGYCWAGDIPLARYLRDAFGPIDTSELVEQMLEHHGEGEYDGDAGGTQQLLLALLADMICEHLSKEGADGGVVQSAEVRELIDECMEEVGAGYDARLALKRAYFARKVTPGNYHLKFSR